MRKNVVIMLLFGFAPAMAQVSLGRKPNILTATHDSIIATFADKGRQMLVSQEQWGCRVANSNDTTSYFARSLIQNKAILQISRQNVRRYNRKTLPSSRAVFENQQLKRLRQTDMYWNTNRNTWMGIGSYILDAIF